MTLLPETKAALARFDDWAARNMKSPDAIALHSKRLERKTRSVGRRMRNMLFGAFAVVLAAVLWGWLVAPIGVLGFLFTILAAMCVMVLLSSWPGERAVVAEALPETPLAALPGRVDSWLESQRRMLPAPAVREIDGIAAQLDRLAPELARLDPASPMADDARRLLGDHLPRLVKSYADVPASHRGTAEATARLRDGLKVVGQELDRMTSSIARDGLDALEVEGKFLESRYRKSVGSSEG